MSNVPLFRDESPLEQDREIEVPPAKRPRFFSSSQDGDQDDDNPIAGPSTLRATNATPSGSKATRANPIETMHLDDDDTPAPRSPSKPLVDATKDTWRAKYFGDVIVKGYAVASASTFVSLKNGDPVKLYRVKPSIASVAEGKKSAAAAKRLENDVVRYVSTGSVVDLLQKARHIQASCFHRFQNSKGIDVGRIAKSDASWLARLMDHDLLEVTGIGAEVPVKFRSGEIPAQARQSRVSHLLVAVPYRSRHESRTVHLDRQDGLHESQPVRARAHLASDVDCDEKEFRRRPP